MIDVNDRFAVGTGLKREGQMSVSVGNRQATTTGDKQANQPDALTWSIGYELTPAPR